VKHLQSPDTALTYFKDLKIYGHTVDQDGFQLPNLKVHNNDHKSLKLKLKQTSTIEIPIEFEISSLISLRPISVARTGPCLDGLHLLDTSTTILYVFLMSPAWAATLRKSYLET
jgi:hypothetical protein